MKGREMKQLTNDEYVAKRGCVCPWCGSNDLSAEEHQCQADGDDAVIPVTCCACGKQWEDLYRLVGYDYEGEV